MAYTKTSYDSGAKEYIIYDGETMDFVVASNALAAGNTYSTLPVDVCGKKFQFTLLCTATQGADDIDLGVVLEGSMDNANWVTVVDDAAMGIDIATTATTDVDTVYVDCSSALFPYWRWNVSNVIIS